MGGKRRNYSPSQGLQSEQIAIVALVVFQEHAHVPLLVAGILPMKAFPSLNFASEETLCNMWFLAS